MAARRKRGGSAHVQAPVQQSDHIVFGDGGNAFAETVAPGNRTDARARALGIMAVALVVVYVLGLIVPKDMLNQALQQSGYNAGYTFSWFVQSLQENVNGLVAVLSLNDDGTFTSTMLRYVVIGITGAGLALTGAVYQGSFKNALVSPSTLGVMSGAGFGVVIWIVFFVNDDGSNVSWLSGLKTAGNGAVNAAAYQGGTWLDDLWATYSMAICTFAGCVVVVGLVLLVMRLAGKSNTSGVMIIITGQVIGAVLGALSNTVRYYYLTADQYGVKASLLQSISIQTFYRTYTVLDVAAVLVPLVVCFMVIMHLRERMMLLQFDEAEARSMGVDVKRMQYAVVGVCTLLTAILIAFCGRVGFVGFLVPHLARRIVGHDFKYLAPASMLLGALFVLVAYVLVSALLGPDYETMAGMYVSILGAVVFLITALRGGKRGELGGFAN